jgi:hypothetical protein
VVFGFGLSLPNPTSLLMLTSVDPISTISIGIKHLCNLKIATSQVVFFNKLLNADKFLKGNAILGDEELLVAGEVLFRLEFFGEC